MSIVYLKDIQSIPFKQNGLAERIQSLGIQGPTYIGDTLKSEGIGNHHLIAQYVFRKLPKMNISTIEGSFVQNLEMARLIAKEHGSSTLIQIEPQYKEALMEDAPSGICLVVIPLSTDPNNHLAHLGRGEYVKEPGPTNVMICDYYGPTPPLVDDSRQIHQSLHPAMQLKHVLNKPGTAIRAAVSVVSKLPNEKYIQMQLSRIQPR